MSCPRNGASSRLSTSLHSSRRVTSTAQVPILEIDGQLTAKINRYVNVNLGAILVYDKDQSSKIQFAQALSIGFLFVL